jgi:hypothetical protein
MLLDVKKEKDLKRGAENTLYQHINFKRWF